MKHLIVGYGQVGSSLFEVIRLKNDVAILDPGKGLFLESLWRAYRPDFTHICVPYDKKFYSQDIKKYKQSGIVVVHSSVPVGTCDALGVVHSPIRGVHPNLAKGIRTFVKYFGGRGGDRVAKVFKGLGIKTKVFKTAKVTEALKLWDTTQYGRLIMLEKEIFEWCKKNKVDFDVVYTQANRDYNEGYIELGRPEVVRPYLKHIPGPIGGHCVLPNSKLLKIKL